MTRDPLNDDELEYLEQRAKNDIRDTHPAHVLSLIEEVRESRKKILDLQAGFSVLDL